jgi:hypothetical protein
VADKSKNLKAITNLLGINRNTLTEGLQRRKYLFASESEWAKMSRKVTSNAIFEDVQHKQLYKDYKDAKTNDKV